MEVSEIKREKTDMYLQQIWLEKIEPKINEKVEKGKSSLSVKAFVDEHSSEKLAKIGRRYGYTVSLLSPPLFSFKNELIIKW